MAPSPSSVSLQFIADQFARGLEEIKDTLRNLQSQVQAGAVDTSAVKTDLENIHDKLDDLYRVVRGDDGSMSVLTRLTFIEICQKDTEKWIESEKSKRTMQEKMGFQTKLAIIAGSFGFLTSIAAALLQLFN
jgi:septation ring formation regulator EzrA